MRIADFLTESSIPDSSYGYWISPEGILHPVDHFSHYAEIIRLGIPQTLDAIEVAVTHGWIRVVSQRKYFEAQLGCRPTNRARLALLRVAKSRDFDEYIGEFALIDDFGKDIIQVSTKMRSEFLRELNKYIDRAQPPLSPTDHRDKVDEEDEIDGIKPDSYGWWIKPDGTILNVPLYSHESVAYALEKYFSKFEAMKEGGWLRLVSNLTHEPHKLYMELRTKPTTRQVSALVKINKINNYGEFVIDLVIPDRGIYHSDSEPTLPRVVELFRKYFPPTPEAPPPLPVE